MNTIPSTIVCNNFFSCSCKERDITKLVSEAKVTFFPSIEIPQSNSFQIEKDEDLPPSYEAVVQKQGKKSLRSNKNYTETNFSIMKTPVVVTCVGSHVYCLECFNTYCVDKCPICQQYLDDGSAYVDQKLSIICDWFFDNISLLFPNSEKSKTVAKEVPKPITPSSPKLDTMRNRAMTITAEENPKDLPVVHYKLCILGGQCGKTSFIFRFINDKWDDKEKAIATVEEIYNKSYVFDTEKCELEIMDTSGDDAYEGMRQKWFQYGNGFILLFSVTSKVSFQEVEFFHNLLMENKKGEGFSKILVGTSVDNTKSRVISREQGKQLANKLGCPYFEVSAKSGIHRNIEYNIIGANIDKSIQALILEMKNSRQKEAVSKRDKYFKKLGVILDDSSWTNKAKERFVVWNEDNVIDNDSPPLIDPWKKNFHVELGSKSTKLSQKYSLYALEKDVYYYRDKLHVIPHINYLAGDSENPVVVSVEDSKSKSLKVILRSKEEDTMLLIPNSVSKEEQIKAFQMMCPNIDFSNYRKCSDSQLSEDLLKFESSQIIKNYKFGVLYCADGQTTEMEMLQNSSGSDDFEEFLNFLGDRILLSRWDGYKGGLSPQYDGTHSVFTKWKQFDIMFHVSTLLPQGKGEQFIEKKRHIGNDCVVIVFKEDSTPFSPSVMKSHFTHVYLVVSKVPHKDNKTFYKISVASKQHVPPYEPFLPYPAIFEKGDSLREFLFHKMVNGERASNKAPDFLYRTYRSRKAYLNQCLNKFK